ncbi:HK97 gp10 family phage protein [Eubacterium sp. AB3007]|uniref:HK97 gp10 family phage protein n=1 Tax=Eubacterium sp. AB3007 TaxID=1392487 RepID=UPI0004854A11|nr:HK97 gp10 family phage protein [Eubacterium sp. AB3007]
MGKKVSIDGLADAVMEELTEYADLVDSDMRKAVTKAGQTVRKEIMAGAPSRTGAYAKSWSTKKTRQSTHSLEVTVYSRNRYQLAHLLEHGHAKRGGGRTRAFSHIAPAEEHGIQQLERDIMRSIRDG